MSIDRAAAIICAIARVLHASSGYTLILSAAAAMLAVACSSGGGGSAPSTPRAAATVASAGCATHAAVARGISDHTLTSGGAARKYELDVPASYDGTRPFALVFGLHPLSISYTVMPSQVGFDDMQKSYDFIGVAPSGLLDGPTPYWFAAPFADNYDVTFISDLLNQLEATLCIDTSRVFSTGISNGAQMSSLLGCRMAGRIKAIAPVEGEEFLAPCNGAPEPILAFHGTADPILPYKGGGLNATNIANIDYWKGKVPAGLPAPLGIDDSMARWAAHNGCDPKPTETRVASDVVKRTWSGCKAATVLYIIAGGGHGWPGKPVPAFEAQFGRTTTSIDATKLVFAFFFGDSGE